MELELRLAELTREYRGTVPGACVLVLHNSQPLVRRAYGMADLGREIPTTSATSYRLASVTKQFTAAAVLLPGEEGALSLDEPVRKWLPSLLEPAAGATLRELLTHTSGLIDYEGIIPPGHTGQLTDADVLRLIESESRTYFAPGSSYRYSNGGYALLALVVERVSGKRFAAFLQERIFGPLGMSGTVAHQRGVSTVINRAYGYSWVEGGWQLTDQSLTSAVLGDGGVYSSIDDLAKWDAALYDARLLRPESLRLAFAPTTATDDPATRYGLGWCITGDTVWHSGESIGFRNVIARWPKRRLTVIVLTNRDGPEPYRLALAIAASVSPGC
jgi:CubicO group peptidase (beta-lactamase class C family)